MDVSRRRPLRILTGLLLAVGAVLAGAQPASAHADLLRTEPANGATLTDPPGEVVLRYDMPVEVRGASVKLEYSGRPLRLPQRFGYASPDRKAVAVSLPELRSGSYVITWFLLGSDGDVMGGELPFTVSGPEGGVAGSGWRPIDDEAPARRSFAPLSEALYLSRLAGLASLGILIGGVAFIAGVWRPGAELRRTRILLGVALAAAIGSNAAALGLRGAALSGRSALSLLSPSALSALGGTHVGTVLTARLAFLVLAVPFLAYLLAAPRRALRSRAWWLGSTAGAVSVLLTHGLLNHAAQRGPLASVAGAVHLGAIAVWLGGLVTLVVVLLPRRRTAELAAVLPRWSHLAFDSVAVAVVAGVALLLLISPRWAAMPGSPYGQFLVVKLGLVVLLLAAARKARDFVWDKLPILAAHSVERDARPETAAALSRAPVPLAAAIGRRPLQPLVTAVTAEVCLAASILTATAVLLGRPPPA